MLLLVVVSLARTSHQPASRTLPTCLQACLQAALQVQSAALQLSQPRKERGVHRPKGDQATIVSRLTKPAALSPSEGADAAAARAAGDDVLEELANVM